MRAMSADGVIHDFPDGTDMAVIDRVMKSYAADIPKRADEAAGKDAASASIWTEAGPMLAHSNGPPEELPAIARYNEPGTETGPDAEAPDLNSSMSKIVGAATQAWHDTPSIAGPATQEFLDQSPVGRQIISPALKIAGAVPAAAHAGMAALSQSLMQVFGEKGGRDALALLSTLPMAPETPAGIASANHYAGRAFPGLVSDATPPTESPRPQFVSERTMPPDEVGLTPLHRIQDLISHDDMENGVATADRGAANQSLMATQSAVMGASDLDGAIAEAAKASGTSDYVPVTVSQVAARDGVGANEAYRRVVEENAARRSPTVSPEPVSVEPQSVGSAASREGTPPDQIAMSMSDMKANRRQAELNELLAPAEPGDNTIYVNGSLPTLAEREGDPILSQTENMLRQRNPGEFIGEGKVLTENNKARVAEFDAHTIPDTTLNSMRRDRASNWDAASKDILPSAKPADLTPAWDWVSNQLENPKIQENDAVSRVLEDFRDRLIDDDSNLKDDPAAVWGMHDHLQNLLAKAKDPLNMTGAEKFAESQIIEAKSLIDQAMNVATDNKFQNALAKYAEDSKAINAGTLLNEFRPKLTNMQGDLQAANFHRFVTGLAKERGDPGIDPSMDISDATMRALINIDKDLKRAGLIKLGAAAGSPTNLLGALAESAGIKAAHGVLSAVPGVGTLVRAAKDVGAQYRLDKLTAKHLAPPEGGYVYPSDAP